MAIDSYLSLFSGVGGFEVGISRVHPEAHCIGFSENNIHATAIYRYQFPTHKELGDVTQINETDFRGVELLVSGFPCQPFSASGLHKGFDDTRGTMFFEIARILRGSRPKYILLENVKGLVSHRQGATFNRMLQILTSIGYTVEWQLVNSKNHRVPHNRVRTYIAGHLGGRSGRPFFPVFGQTGQNHRRVGYEVPYCLDASYHKGADTVTEERRRLALPEPFIVASRGRYNPDGSTSQRYEAHFDGFCNTLTTVQKDNLLFKDGIRYLTPIECERLQGFNPGWTEVGLSHQRGHLIISKTQRYRRMGNAVTTNVVEAIIRNATL